MLLVGVKESNGWILSRWNLTYKVGWEHICKAVQAVYEFYEHPEILADNQSVAVAKKEDILKIDEKSDLIIRGFSKIIKVPIMITFLNQTQVVDVSVAKATKEFAEADYQKFNMSLCQYMDSIELAMYR